MQFKHPEILFALFLLIIPIIVHLFQLRRFKKVPFTNVKFLKQVEQSARKSSKLKKFLILCTRLLALTALIIAFAQPYISSIKNKKPIKTYIYLDNSLSMQAKGSKGELLKRSAQDIIEIFQSGRDINLITNNSFLKNLSIDDLKKELLNMDYYPISQELNTTLFKIKNDMKNSGNSLNEIFLFSDFQYLNELNLDSINSYNLVQLTPVKKSNISIDSVYIAERNNDNITLKTIIKGYNLEKTTTTISLFDNSILLGKSNALLTQNQSEVIDFVIPNKEILQGKLIIEDADLPFDNELYFAINSADKINVLAIGANNDYLSKIYTEDEFNYLSASIEQLDYSKLNEQNLIILNELESIPKALISSLKEFINNQGDLVIIPSSNKNTNYNTLFLNLNIGGFPEKIETEISVTTINFSHPLLKNVFEKEIKNFQYPTVKSYYNFNTNRSNSILKFENEVSFISQTTVDGATIYMLASAINETNSNFKNSPLIVPIFYNFGKHSYKHSQINYTIGDDNEIEVSLQLEKDNILHISNKSSNFIPLQQVGNRSVKINITEQPLKNGIYQLKNKEVTIKNLAFNYNRKESDLVYPNVTELIKEKDNVSYFSSIKDAIISVDNQYKTNNLWRIFLTLSIIFLLSEMLLLKFFKS